MFSKECFKPYQFLDLHNNLAKGEPSNLPPLRPLIPGQEMFLGLQLLQVNIDMQGEVDMLSNMYNLVYQQNSQVRLVES